MYSVVLLMAMAGGGDVPAGHGCYGGGCYGGGYGCDGGCWGSCGGSSCHGSKHGGRSRGHGCHGGRGHGCRGGKHGGGHGCCGGYSCNGCHGGYASGCCGGGYGCTGGYGYSCMGGAGCYGSAGYGCTGGAGCWGGAGAGCYGAGAGCYGGEAGYGAPMMGTPVPAGTPVKPEEIKKKPMTGLAAPATIVVSLPAEAKLLIDDEATASKSAQRVFVSPSLNPGRDYHYTLKAEWVRDGKPMNWTKEIAVRAGEETRVQVAAEQPASVASR